MNSETPTPATPFYGNSECADCSAKLYGGKTAYWIPTSGATPGMKLVCERCKPSNSATLATPEVQGARDWTEDFSHENGNYQNRCCLCNNVFIGHKRRVTCKLCAKPLPAPSAPEYVRHYIDSKEPSVAPSAPTVCSDCDNEDCRCEDWIKEDDQVSVAPSAEGVSSDDKVVYARIISQLRTSLAAAQAKGAYADGYAQAVQDHKQLDEACDLQAGMLQADEAHIEKAAHEMVSRYLESNLATKNWDRPTMHRFENAATPEAILSLTQYVRVLERALWNQTGESKVAVDCWIEDAIAQLAADAGEGK